MAAVFPTAERPTARRGDSPAHGAARTWANGYIVEASGYFGNLLRRRVAGPFVVTESAFRSGSALPVHAHDASYFTFTLHARYRERCGARRRLCTPGTAVAHPAFEMHSQEFADEPALLIRIALAPGETESEVEAAFEAALHDELVDRSRGVAPALRARVYR